MEIADGVEEIGNYTFYGCGNLRRLSFTDLKYRRRFLYRLFCAEELRVLMVLEPKAV
ncbi:MAG: hypothetical protein ACLRMZ_22400 [Blautia marasmi]